MNRIKTAKFLISQYFILCEMTELVKLMLYCFEVCMDALSYWVECFTTERNPLWMCSLWDFRSPPRSSWRSRPSPLHQTTPGWVWLLCGGSNQPTSALHNLIKKQTLLDAFIVFGRTRSPSDRQRQLDENFGLDLDGDEVFLFTCPVAQKRENCHSFIFLPREGDFLIVWRSAAALTFAAAARCRCRWCRAAWPWHSGWCRTSSGWTNKLNTFNFKTTNTEIRLYMLNVLNTYILTLESLLKGFPSSQSAWEPSSLGEQITDLSCSITRGKRSDVWTGTGKSASLVSLDQRRANVLTAGPQWVLNFVRKAAAADTWRV